MLKRMGNPEKALKFVHAAGTNGKGSVTYLTASLLSAAGYRVGRFSSPHLHSYLERFTIDGREIEAGDFIDYLDYIKGLARQMEAEGEEHPTEFEILTALAFQYFKDKQVDLAVMEAGLGGVYDSTNVVAPLVSVITSVDYDHTQLLGDTLTEIAENKAGIIKPGIPVVAGILPEEADRVVREEARRQNAPCFDRNLIRVAPYGQPGIEGQEICLDLAGEHMSGVYFGLAGNHQLENLRLSLAVVHLLRDYGFHLSPQILRKTLKSIKFPGRLEVICRNPLVIADAGHNPHAARALADSLNTILGPSRKVLLCGYLDDKDVVGALSYLGENTSKCIVSRPEGDRAEKWYRSAEVWKQLYPEVECHMREDIEKAVELGMELLKEDEYLLITGSFYLLDKARRQFTNA